MLTREDVQVHLHAPQTMIEQFQLFEWRHYHLGILHCCSEITSETVALDTTNKVAVLVADTPTKRTPKSFPFSDFVTRTVMQNNH
jgi:hypothetical protein